MPEKEKAAGTRTTEPEDVKRELHTIYRAGAKGVILSRSLGEMREYNLKAAGEAIQEINAAMRGGAASKRRGNKGHKGNIRKGDS